MASVLGEFQSLMFAVIFIVLLSLNDLLSDVHCRLILFLCKWSKVFLSDWLHHYHLLPFFCMLQLCFK